MGLDVSKIERMPKDEFIKKLTDIQKDEEYYTALFNVTQDYNRPLDEVNICPNSIFTAIEALEWAIGDKNETVSWWCFEKNWGKRGKEFCVTDGKGNIIPTETMEDVYDLVTHDLEELKMREKINE